MGQVLDDNAVTIRERGSMAQVKVPISKLGSEFWELLGGPGTDSELLELFAEVGQERRSEVLRILGIH